MEPIVLERMYDAAPDVVWRLWTTASGIESWWAPDGFEVTVEKLDLEPGGELVYAMTATGPAQVEFMQGAGLPLTTRSRKTFTEVEPEARLGYRSLIDFVPGVEPYEHLTTVELHEASGGARIVMTMEPLHDDTWTERLVQGRSNELANLEAVLQSPG